MGRNSPTRLSALATGSVPVRKPGANYSPIAMS
jgi:hypothetical protein